jgi:hypothetical protein
LRFRNGRDFVLIPEEEPSPLSCYPSEKVRGFSGKESSELLLKRALEYSTLMGIMCVGSEGQLPPLFMDLIASHFFFIRVMYIKKAQRGATHSTQEVYMKPLI